MSHRLVRVASKSEARTSERDVGMGGAFARFRMKTNRIERLVRVCVRESERKEQRVVGRRSMAG